MLLYALTVCVRALTQDQAMRLLGFTDRANYKRFTRSLIARGLVSEITVWAKPVPEMSEPLFSSDPGSPARIAGEARAADGSIPVAEILRLARVRWAGRGARPTRAVVATGRGRNTLGVHRCGRLYGTKYSHDLAVSEAFLAFHRTRAEGREWRGEDSAVMHPEGETVPDALIFDSGGGLRKIIEVVGEQYREAKIVLLGRFAGEIGVSCEFW